MVERFNTPVLKTGEVSRPPWVRIPLCPPTLTDLKQKKWGNMKYLISAFALLLCVGCTTTANFKVPANETLMVTDRVVAPDSEGKVTTSPFFWSEAGGIPYRLSDSKGNVVRSGHLKSQFRVTSIFWPPFALIYWPMGFNKNGYDLTKTGDGYFVVDAPKPSK
jgi:hypothetical protein